MLAGLNADLRGQLRQQVGAIVLLEILFLGMLWPCSTKEVTAGTLVLDVRGRSHGLEICIIPADPGPVHHGQVVT